MKERSILMAGSMVRALLDGRKTQTRRVVMTRHPITHLGGSDEADDPATWGWAFDGPDFHGYAVLGRGLNEDHDNGRTSIPCPYGEPGDRLWVRETFAIESDCGIRYDPPYKDGRPLRVHETDDGEWWEQPHYRATDPAPDLIVIDKDGYEHPGVRWRPSIHMPRWASRITLEVTSVRVERVAYISDPDAEAEGIETSPNGHPAHIRFAELWDSINGKRPGCSWDANPFVWAVGFKVVR